ncbi:amino-acid N-acetyltransferase [Nitrococcus mobilis]|uniref:Amino-acid acetyltransferase n=1 Tax=Nitrococcus mobilis Nb-231 TaxID=314278 RepID=A4BS84_9GAMM|nr:amino-acid N-acetyltransferase [Nitrococcus mobilis]EAR21344.1 N-acetylglutamate synthase [Nitrococcus mobilis Nb-231]
MKRESTRFVDWFRHSSPYINAHRGRTFVIAFGGETVADGTLPALIHDLALLSSLGVRLVLVPGARPQIEQRLRARGCTMRYVNGLRITDELALACVKEAVGTVRVEIEALLSMGLANSPMAGLRIRVASGNFVTARPLGIRDGVDYLHTGEVRRVDGAAIRQRLDDNAVVLIASLGYSPTGEVFNLYSEDVALAVAREVCADKLLFLQEGAQVYERTGALVREMTTEEVQLYLHEHAELTPELRRLLTGTLEACRGGVRRVHLLGGGIDGALLLELFTRDGAGTLITARPFEITRAAVIDDIGGILELIEPLERDGTLVRRSRERLETEVEHFTVIVREGTIIACAALYRMPDAALAELACFVVHPDYRGGERGDALLRQMERTAAAQGVQTLFVLTTRSAHWFQERGFQPASLQKLPVGRQRLYNFRRNSRVFIKQL